jgi:hypothetical protein
MFSAMKKVLLFVDGIDYSRRQFLSLNTGDVHALYWWL